jgi:hypothetical protein
MLEFRDGVGEDENLELKLEIHELLLPSFFGVPGLKPFLLSSVLWPLSMVGRVG